MVQLKMCLVVGHEGQAADVVEVGVREHDVADAAHLGERQIADAGAGVDQQLVIDQHAGGAQSRPDPPAAPQNLDPHWYGDTGRNVCAGV